MTKRIDVGKKENLSVNPFDKIDLSGVNLIENKKDIKPSLLNNEDVIISKNRKIEVRREKGGRGGKEVTVIVGFEENEVKEKLKEFQRFFGVGGTVKASAIELQGDQKAGVKEYLSGKGYKVVFTGG